MDRVSIRSIYEDGEGEYTVTAQRLTWREIQQEYNRAGQRISKKAAQGVMGAMPTARIATGWTEGEILEITIKGGRAALKRLMSLAGNGNVS